ncbi:MAG: hypothetical protein LLG04_06380 [Parachlamydia sp.]|nr:hypothetical protein [Parachlamydia sp.]
MKELALELAAPDIKEDQETYLDALGYFVSLFPQLGHFQKMEEAIAELLRECQCQGQFVIIDSKTTPQHGNSHDEVFFIHNQTGELAYVVKAFREPASYKSRYLLEIAANTLIEQNSCAHFSTVDILGSALCIAHGAFFALLLETPAPGTRLDQFAFHTSALDASDPLRELKMAEAKEAFYAAGAALARFYQIENLSWKYLSRDDAHRIYKKLAKVKPLHEMIDLQALEVYVDRIVQQALETPFKSGYQHGAAHVRNLFYHPELKRITFIDNGHLVKSFEGKWQPIGDPAQDLVRLQESLFHKACDKLTEQEMDTLIQSIYQGYASQGTLPDKRLLKFYLLERKLSPLTDPENPEHRDLINYSLEYLKKELS